MYIGWAQKRDSDCYSSTLVNKIKNETMTTNDDILEYQDPFTRRTMQRKKHLNTNNAQNRKRILPIKQNRKTFIGGEKLIRSYTYN